jgi:hypothetical protein
MAETRFVVTKEDGTELDLSAHLVGLHRSASERSFCSSFSATLVCPPEPYVKHLLPGSLVSSATTDDEGRTLRVLGKLDEVRALGTQGELLGTLQLRGRGIEAYLLDKDVLWYEPVEAFDDCLRELLARVVAHIAPPALAQSGVRLDPEVRFPCRVGVTRASPFEALRDVADHFGYSFWYDPTDAHLVWTRPGRQHVEDGRVPLFTPDGFIGDFVSLRDGTESYHKDLDDWW